MIVDNDFVNLVEESSPKMNPIIMKGVATFTLPKAKEYLNAVFTSGSRSLPAGLEFIGIRPLTEEEDFFLTTKDRNNRRTFNIAHSTVSTQMFQFRFKGELIERPITLPYCNEFGLFSLSGTEYHFIPVISDKVLSPGFNDVFIRLLKDRLTFLARHHSVVVDEVGVTCNVVYGDIYRNKSKKERKAPITTGAHTTAVHYLLARYGFSGMFKRYTGCVPTVGYEEINPEAYPPEEWVIVKTAFQNVAPHGIKGNYYRSTKLRLAIPRAKWSPAMLSLVTGFFYIADHFSDLVVPEFVEDPRRWMVMIGHIVFSGVYGYDKLYTSINEHIMTLNDYIDPMAMAKLREIGVDVEDFYDLMFYVILNFESMIMERSKNQLTMFGKSLETLYYVFFDLTSGYHRAIYKLNRIAVDRVLTRKHIDDAFNQFFKTGTVFKLTSDRIYVAPMSTSTDHSYCKGTAMAVPQEANTSGVRGRRGRLSVGDSQHLHASMMETGSLLFVSKSDPSPTRHLNPYTTVDPNTMTLIPNPDKDIRFNVERVQALLKGKKVPKANQ